MRKVVPVAVSTLCVVGGVVLGLAFAGRAPTGVNAPLPPMYPQANAENPRRAKAPSLVEHVAPAPLPSPAANPKSAAQPVKDAKPPDPDDTLPERPGGWPRGIIGQAQ